MFWRRLIKTIAVFVVFIFAPEKSFASEEGEIVSEIVELAKRILEVDNSSDRKHSVTSRIFSDVSHFKTDDAQIVLNEASLEEEVTAIYQNYIDVVASDNRADHPGIVYLTECAMATASINAHKCSIALAEISAMLNDRTSVQKWVIHSTDVLSEIDFDHPDYWFSNVLTSELLINSYAYDRNAEKALDAGLDYLNSASKVDVPLNTYTLINNLVMLLDRSFGSEEAWSALEILNLDLSLVPQESREIILYTYSKISVGVEDYKSGLEYSEKLSEIVEHPVIKKVHFGYMALSSAKTGKIQKAKSAISESRPFYPEGFENRFGRYILMAQKEIAIHENRYADAIKIDQTIDRVNDELNAAVLSQERTRLAGNMLLSNERFNRERDKLQFKAELSAQQAKASRTQLLLSLCALVFLVGLVTYVFRSFRKEKRLNAEIQGVNIELEKKNKELHIAHANVTNTFERLKVAHRQAMAGQEAKQKFIGVVGHELRTPLNPIINLSEVLEARESDPKDKALLKAIKNAGKRLHIIVENMLAISSASKDSQVFIEMVDVVYEATTVVEEFVPDIRERNVQLKDEGKYVNVNVFRHPDFKNLQVSNKIIYRSIIRNLFDNAVKFTTDGEISLHLNLRDKKRGFQLEVRDTGIGMDVNKIEEFMRPFEQAEMGLGRSHEGAGLGLAVVHKYCEQLGAKMQIKSTVGKGTRITIDFPEPAHESETGKLLKVA